MKSKRNVSEIPIALYLNNINIIQGQDIADCFTVSILEPKLNNSSDKSNENNDCVINTIIINEGIVDRYLKNIDTNKVLGQTEFTLYF